MSLLDDLDAVEAYLASDECGPEETAIIKAALEKEWNDWHNHARPEQLPPEGNHNIWFLLGGRGGGKTRTGAETVKGIMGYADPPLANVPVMPGSRGAIVTPKFAAGRDVCIEGDGGLLDVLPPGAVRAWNRSNGELILNNGSSLKLYSDEAPEGLRGPNFAWAWCDEPASWLKNGILTWDMLRLALRKGDPFTVVTGTPKNLPLIRHLMGKDVEIGTRKLKGRKDVAVSRFSTYDNAANLAEQSLAEYEEMYEGTRLGRQELHAELLEDVEGALWRTETIEPYKELDLAFEGLDLRTVVVSVDPAVTSNPDSADTGIIVAGKSRIDGHDYVIADRTIHGTGYEWASRAIKAYHEFQANYIVAEVNQGGDLVIDNIHQIDPNIPVETVHASRGKDIRAQPVATRYEKGKVHHLTSFHYPTDNLAKLEDGMTTWDPASGISNDRIDALVWAITDLSIKQAGTGQRGTVRDTRLRGRR